MLVRNRFFVAVTVLILSSAALLADQPLLGDQPLPNDRPPPFVQIVPHFETGVVAILSHLYQSGGSSTDTPFNFITQGGQDILFPYQRLSVDFHLGEANIVTLLYQPLTLATKTVVGKNGTPSSVVVDGVTFGNNVPLDLVYGFDFWRASWLYNFAQGRGEILGAGLSLQIRNASISFTSTDGSQRAISQNIGPVPILKTRYAHWFTPEFGVDVTADGIYVASAFFNGATKDFAGWLWDTSVSLQTRFIPGSTAFVTVRSIGGGAQGNNAYEAKTATTSSASSYSYNALATAALTLGVELN
ncbi:MAG: hypothetical protein WCG80_10365 [Spirochaetales bacterium]